MLIYSIYTHIHVMLAEPLHRLDSYNKNKNCSVEINLCSVKLSDRMIVFCPFMLELFSNRRSSFSISIFFMSSCLSSSERQAPRTPSVGRWSSLTGLPRPRRRPGSGRTWRKALRRAARRSSPCRRSPSRTGRSNLQGWSLRWSPRG